MKKAVFYHIVDNVIRVRVLITYWAKEYPLKKFTVSSLNIFSNEQADLYF